MSANKETYFEFIYNEIPANIKGNTLYTLNGEFVIGFANLKNVYENDKKIFEAIKSNEFVYDPLKKKLTKVKGTSICLEKALSRKINLLYKNETLVCSAKRLIEICSFISKKKESNSLIDTYLNMNDYLWKLFNTPELCKLDYNTKYLGAHIQIAQMIKTKKLVVYPCAITNIENDFNLILWDAEINDNVFINWSLDPKKTIKIPYGHFRKIWEGAIKFALFADNESPVKPHSVYSKSKRQIDSNINQNTKPTKLWKFCATCGMELNSSWKYCPTCRTELHK